MNGAAESMDRIVVERVAGVPQDLGALIDAAEAEGLEFMTRLRDGGRAAGVTYSGPGESFLEARHVGALVGVCGLSLDHYAGDPRIGRVRHVYVYPAWRRRGVGEALVRAAVLAARGHFDVVRLRALDARAARVYERAGFAPTSEADATHRIETRRPATGEPPARGAASP